MKKYREKVFTTGIFLGPGYVLNMGSGTNRYPGSFFGKILSPFLAGGMNIKKIKT